MKLRCTCDGKTGVLWCTKYGCDISVCPSCSDANCKQNEDCALEPPDCDKPPCNCPQPQCGPCSSCETAKCAAGFKCVEKKRASSCATQTTGNGGRGGKGGRGLAGCDCPVVECVPEKKCKNVCAGAKNCGPAQGCVPIEQNCEDEHSCCPTRGECQYACQKTDGTFVPVGWTGIDVGISKCAPCTCQMDESEKPGAVPGSGGDDGNEGYGDDDDDSEGDPEVLEKEKKKSSHADDTNRDGPRPSNGDDGLPYFECLVQDCPITCQKPICKKPIPGCSYKKSSKRDDFGCKVYPCGRLNCMPEAAESNYECPEVDCPTPLPGCFYTNPPPPDLDEYGCSLYPCGVLECDRKKCEQPCGPENNPCKPGQICRAKKIDCDSDACCKEAICHNILTSSICQGLDEDACKEKPECKLGRRHIWMDGERKRKCKERH